MTDDEVLKLCVGLDVDILSAQRRGEPLRPVLERFARHVYQMGVDETTQRAVNVIKEEGEKRRAAETR